MRFSCELHCSRENTYLFIKRLRDVPSDIKVQWPQHLGLNSSSDIFLPRFSTRDHKNPGAPSITTGASNAQEMQAIDCTFLCVFRNFKNKNNHGIIHETSHVFISPSISDFFLCVWGGGKPILVPCGFKLSKGFYVFGGTWNFTVLRLALGLYPFGPGYHRPFLEEVGVLGPSLTRMVKGDMVRQDQGSQLCFGLRISKASCQLLLSVHIWKKAEYETCSCACPIQSEGNPREDDRTTNKSSQNSLKIPQDLHQGERLSEDLRNTCF